MGYDPDFMVRRDYERLQAEFPTLPFKAWADLTDDEKEKVRAEYKRHTAWMESLGAAIRTGTYISGGPK